ncbi:DoxX family protein [Nocardia pseudobrasiliensis]|uniref:DoxX-like protein n=1 Tax=Nocardia pseudobrasiliensis TaxID=45979 RepID=A0A370I120_9NOCA|nr:DoxX family protein [Nocardia pseudobrasiliensis]RDI63881.1 DoxX-like protein [Nocardia pseudobrasiliensis]
MHIATLILSVLLALAMLHSGVMKFVRPAWIRRFAEAVHLTTPQLAVLGSLQIAATIGLLWGIWFPPFAIAAAIGLVLYFVGAIGAHIRSGDRNMVGATGFLALSIATLILLGLAPVGNA